MKRTIINGFLLMLFVFGISSYAQAEVIAQGDTSVKAVYAEGVQVKANATVEADAPNRGVREGAQTQAQESAPQQDKAGVKATVATKIEVKAERYFGKMTERYGATIDRLDNILLRLNSRITKMKAEGATTTVAENFAATATLEIAAARTSLASVSAGAVIADSETATTTKAAMSALNTMKKTSKETSKHIVAAKVNLEKAIASLKIGGGVKAEIKSQGKTESGSKGQESSN